MAGVVSPCALSFCSGSLNAAVVGILIAALYHPIGTSSLVSWWDVVCCGPRVYLVEVQTPTHPAFD